MAGDLIWAFRVMRLPLRDAGGANIGRVQDIVAVPGGRGDPPCVTGFVAESQRRRIFVNSHRVAELGPDGARLRSWDVDLNPFKVRPGEVLVGRDVIDHRVGDETVSDVALQIGEGVRGTEFEIRTRKPKKVNADGELLTETPAVFKVHPKALTVFAPAG